MWKKINETKISHDDGHWVELLDGSWKLPFNINPQFFGDLHPFAIAGLLREGLKFAAKTEMGKNPVLGKQLHETSLAELKREPITKIRSWRPELKNNLGKA